MVIKMRYAVDEIIDDKVKLESLDDGTILCVDKSFFPKSIREGNIVLKTEKYIIDYDFEKKRREELYRKFNQIKKNKE